VRKFLKFGCGGLIGLVVLIGIITAISNGGKSNTASVAPGNAAASPASPAASPVSSPASTKPATQASAAPKVGDTVTKGNWAYTVTKVDKPGKSIDTGNQFIKLDALGTWLAVYTTLKNVGNANFPINTTDFQLQDAAGTKSDVTSHIVEMDTWLDKNNLKQLGEQIPPGISFDTALLFDVNPDAKGFKLNLKQANTLVDLGV